MTETKAKPKTGKPPVAKSETAVKAPAKTVKVKPAVKAKGPSKAKDADGQIKVTQLVGSIARRHDQEATLIGLGLNKRHRSKVLENTPSVRGMVYKVRHLVKVEKVG